MNSVATLLDGWKTCLLVYVRPLGQNNCRRRYRARRAVHSVDVFCPILSMPWCPKAYYLSHEARRQGNCGIVLARI